MTAFTGEVHPAADVWPLLPDDELEQLAESIRANGLLDPITLDEDGQLLDGRNRLAAATKAEVEPRFVTYDGDPVLFIVARNGERRHMTTGSRAMATAVNLAEAGHRSGGRWRRGTLDTHESMITGRSWFNVMTQAGLVLDHVPDLAAAVISGEMALDAAYKRARTAKAKKESEESRLAALVEEEPDLAEKVDNEELTLGEAEAVKAERDAEAEKQFKASVKSTQGLASGWAWLVHLAAGRVDRADEILEQLNDRDRELVDEALVIYRKGVTS